MHNGYKTTDGELLESDIAKALKEEGVEAILNRKIIDADGRVLGEIDAETANWIIEATTGKGSKLSQMQKYFTEIFNPNNKSVVLIGPNYTNSNAIKAIEELGAKVVHSVDDLIELIK